MRDAVLIAVFFLSVATLVAGSRRVSPLRLTGGVLVGMLLSGFLAACWVEIPPGAVGTVYDPLAGGIQGVDLRAGWHLVPPWAHVHPWSVRIQEYTMSGKRDEGAVVGDDSMICQTSEGLQVRIDATALFHVQAGEAHKLWKTVGTSYINTIVRPAMREAIRTNVSQYPMVSVYSNAPQATAGNPAGKRQEIEEHIQAALEPTFEAKGIKLDHVLLRNVDYVSSDYERAIVNKQVAQQQVLTQNYLLHIEQIKARQKVVQSEGQAEAIRLRGIALRANRGVIRYEFVRRLPADMDITVVPGGGSIILNLPNPSGKPQSGGP